ncbi:TetR/AcrR family transcriptional regulator [Thalassotalea sediminis]|uniref:TetR/AcrR family transcriptional regulator n=1 Tax=Thalassotalea sediminis TaxID=1759089 RepID=UPI002572E7CC|nr:TetR/AcrR family transcriptional regulator [Thalassotalea sediminis]
MQKITDKLAKPLSDRGERILAAAQTLFLQHGFEKTSLDMIISESGGSRRSIYNEFGNKQGLLLAVLREKVALQRRALESLDKNLPPQEALTNVCVKFVTGMLSHTMLALFRVVSQLVVKMPEIGEYIYQQGPMQCRGLIGNYLAELEQQGVVKIDDKDYAAQLLIEMANGRLHFKSLLLANTKVTKQEIEREVALAVKLFLKAYAP